MPTRTNNKNAKGGGTIRQRPDGRWEAAILSEEETPEQESRSSVPLWADTGGSAKKAFPDQYGNGQRCL